MTNTTALLSQHRGNPAMMELERDPRPTGNRPKDLYRHQRSQQSKAQLQQNWGRIAQRSVEEALVLGALSGHILGGRQSITDFFKAASPSNWVVRAFSEPNYCDYFGFFEALNFQLEVVRPITWDIAEVDRREETPVFLRHAQRLAEQNNIDSALDVVFARVDLMLRQGDLDEVEKMLESVEPLEFGEDVLLALLTTTLPARRRLEQRPAFVERVSKRFEELGHDVESLLVGLK